MNKKEEAAYMQGMRMAYTNLLNSAVRYLGAEDQTIATLLAEREGAIAVLRRICEDHGDNDWDDNLHLADIIEKHLGNYLEN